MGNVNAKFDSLVARLPLGKKCGGVYKVFTIVLILIPLYIILLMVISGSTQYHQYDIVNNIAATLPIFGRISYWPITHFILFFILGLLFPNCDVLVIALGIIWEIFEEIYGRMATQMNIPQKSKVQYVRWWSGSLTDIVFNIAGFYFGKMIVKTFDLEIKIPCINGNTCNK